MKPLLDGFKALGVPRLVALAAVGVGMLVMIGLLAFGNGGGGDEALLYADLDTRETAQMTDVLNRAHIAYQASPAGDRLAVGSADVARARLLLAKEGLPSGGSIGYEIFDRGDAMTASDFEQQINETRALEGELARSIRMLQGVRAARVHLVLPKREVFSRDTAPAQASVLITMYGQAHLDSEGVQAILNLVAAAVPGLKPQAIAVIDSHGTLLARAGQPASDQFAAASAEELRHATEQRLARAVEDMLESVVGPGHVRAEASVQMSFDKVNETSENYDPNQQVVRSTQSTSEKNVSTEADKSTSVQNNLPNADAGQAQSGSQQQKQDEVTNYEIGKTVRTLIHEQPQISRISLAVLVDGVWQKDKTGAPQWQPRSAEEIASIRNLVESAIGYDEKRADHVEIASMRFAALEDGDASPPAGLFGMNFDKADLVSIARSSLLAIVVLVGLLLVLRPMVARLSINMPSAELAFAGNMMPSAQALTERGGEAGGGMAMIGEAPIAGMITDEGMVSMSNVDGQLRASSIRKLAEMVEKSPEASLAVIRGWMSQEQG